MCSIADISSKFDEYLSLSYKISKGDPDDDPFKSKYAARALLIELKEQLNVDLPFDAADPIALYQTLSDTVQRHTRRNVKCFLVEKLIDFNIAKNYIETEELQSGEIILTCQLRQLEDILTDNNDPTHSIRTYNPLVYSLIVNVLQELIYVWSGRSVYENCLKLLIRSKEVYEYYKANRNNQAGPYQPNELIKIDEKLTDDKREALFESLYTHSLFYMAQIYGKLGDKEQSAYYCQLTLQRQLEFSNTNENIIDQFTSNLGDETAISFSPIDWATHCAALSQYYLNSNEFATARHCLVCSDLLLTNMNKTRTRLDEVELSKLDEQFARINRCWSKYGIGLLRYSTQQLSNDKISHVDLVQDLDKPPTFQFDLSKQLNSNMHFDQESFITSNIALDFDQAKSIFVKTLGFLDKAKSYFKLDGHVTDHCDILRDISELYTHIMYFDGNAENQSKYLKRKLDLLKPVADELNEQYYMAIKRQYLYDIATIYSDMMDVKIDVLNKKRESTTAGSGAANNERAYMMVQKINLLIRNAIRYFQLFLNTMKILPEKTKLPDKFDEYNVRSALLAHFHMGRLHSKFITNDISERLNNTKNSFENYSYVVDYCEKHENTMADSGKIMDIMKTEYSICKEMITFMPAKMENLRKNIK